MQRWFLIIILPLLSIASCNGAADNTQAAQSSTATIAANRKTVTGKVIGISDGDTFRLLTDSNETVRVRLHGIDAPEKGQDYSTQSQQKLSELIFSKQVVVEQKNKDRYGRVVGIAFVDRINVNEEMLRSGLAWQYREYDKTEKWASIQTEAQQNKRGLWSMSSPTPPWEWRKEKKVVR
ncbi:MAG TPA: thermonuclease family protein [Flavisolibacter sp.]|nr:thermonuclease family protein [Flavisolibacter sp.]